ncbi:MAG: TetR/AcrR family transcriptional regulator [Candidatus Sericytochromatia bacterium]
MCKKKITQEKVLNAAEKIFGSKGYHGSTTKEIAEEAGVSEGIIFKYFKTKKELLVNLVVPIISKTAVSLLVNNSDEDLEDFINKVFQDRIKFFKRVFPLMKIIFFENELDDSLRNKIFQELLSSVAKEIQNIYQKRIDSGELRNIDAFDMARTMMSLLIGLAIMNEISKGRLFEPYKVEDFIPKSIDIFLRGIKK